MSVHQTDNDDSSVLLWLESKESLKTLTLESVLSGVHCFRCHDHTQLIAVSRTLDTFLSQHPKVC